MTLSRTTTITDQDERILDLDRVAELVRAEGIPAFVEDRKSVV